MTEKSQPTTLPYSSGRMTGTCPLCNVRPFWKKPLYGHGVCKKCYYRFANRRQLAYIVDALIFVLPVTILNFLVLTSLARSGVNEVALTLAASAVGVGLMCVFVCKDGFTGQSPGKRLMGVQVMDQTSGQPIGFGQSFKRNAPLLVGQIPYVGRFVGGILVIVIALGLNKGYRLGDRFANTRVIWKRFARLPIFGGDALACETCGYDLSGNASGVCPECGSPVSERNAARLAVAPAFAV